jgi:hypothetical protein
MESRNKESEEEEKKTGDEVTAWREERMEARRERWWVRLGMMDRKAREQDV